MRAIYAIDVRKTVDGLIDGRNKVVDGKHRNLVRIDMEYGEFNEFIQQLDKSLVNYQKDGIKKGKVVYRNVIIVTPGWRA